MLSHKFNDFLDIFYEKLSDTDKTEFQAIKSDRFVKWDKRRKILNYGIITLLVILIGITFFFSDLNFDNLSDIALLGMFSFIINNSQLNENEKIWDKFLDIHLVDLEELKKVQYHSKQQRRYVRARYYIFKKIRLSNVDFQALIHQIIRNKDIPNEKTKQYRYDEYHYLAMVEEIKLRATDDYKLIFPSAKIFVRSSLLWILMPLPTIFIISNYNLESLMIPKLGGIALIIIWSLVVIFLFVNFVYSDSKYNIINRWEKYFTSQDWDLFDRPQFLFSDFGTLDKYATLYFSKKLNGQ